MASITIRNLEELLKAELRCLAAKNNRSMEEEVRNILRTWLTQTYQPARDLGQAIHQRFASLGGVDLPAIEGNPLRTSAEF